MVVEVKPDVRRPEIYWATELDNWQASGTYILPDKLWIATRDPHIMKGNDGKYWIHVVSTGNKGVKQSQVIRIRTKDFVRFRVGIKPKRRPKNLDKFVLKNFSKTEKEVINKTIKKTSKAIAFVLEQGLEKAMNEFNKE